jgi:cytochrome c-type biogenesis protein CcmH/NrfG
MSRDGIIFGVAGACFGLILGWIIGSQQTSGRAMSVSTPAAAESTAPAGQPQAPPIDLQRANALEQQAKAQPNDAVVRADLGNLYFDSQRFDLAIPWYEQAYKLDPKNINVSTDLAVSYYYTDQPDKALAQIDQSLKIDPKHPTTLLNQGIVRAFGKQDFTGAVESWDKVIAYAPDSPDAAKARTLKQAHSSAGSASDAGRGGRGGL